MKQARTTRLALALAATALALMSAGCRQDMQDQPKFVPQRGTEFFADHRSARPQVVNTIARGQLREDRYFYTGLIEGTNGYKTEKDELPFAVTPAVLARGQERFNIYCSPCHSRVGNGLGEIVERGYKPAGNLMDQVHQAQPLSHFFVVMTHGFNAMPDYATQLTPVDRWAVAAYIRALQLSQNATVKDLPSGARVGELKAIAVKQGLPAEFASPWQIPKTAAHPMPADPRQGTPGNAPSYPQPDLKYPVQTVPKQNSQPASGNATTPQGAN
jgi:mono/diheme cytochrome c family protein